MVIVFRDRCLHVTFPTSFVGCERERSHCRLSYNINLHTRLTTRLTKRLTKRLTYNILKIFVKNDDRK